jgi:cyclic pyranopterin phosphate synthase
MIRDGAIKKGDVLAVAQVAGIMGAKQTSHYYTNVHPLSLSGVDMDFELDENKSSIVITSQVRLHVKPELKWKPLQLST